MDRGSQEVWGIITQLNIDSPYMTTMREYQTEMLERIRKEWRRVNHVLVQMPTGTGKTVLLAEVIKKGIAISPSRKGEGSNRLGGVLIVAHRRELIAQISQTLNGFGIEHGLIVSGKEIDRTKPVQVASIQTLTLRMKKEEEISNLEFSMVVIDEAHHALARTYKRLFERWPKAKFLGVTATPCRMNGAPFTDLFDVLLQSKDIQWFIKEGWLSDFEYVSVPPDSEEMRKVKGLKKRGTDGDYQTKEMATVLDCPESIRHLYNTYYIYTRGKKGIVYAIDKAHAQHIAEYYTEKGVNTCWIEANTPAKERERLVQEYREGRMDVIVNVDIFTEGFDCPEVEFIQLARPTLSLAKYLQQVGRGMRVSEGKPFVTILDQVGLYQTFGLPTDNRDWQKMFVGKAAGKGLAKEEERPLIIRDEVADKGLLNLEMLHIKRFNEQRTRLEVFLLGGRFGIMCMGHVTCSPQFRRVQRLPKSKYYALAVYDHTKEEYTTVIDNDGRNMRLAFRGEVSIEDDIFIQKDAHGRCAYYDAISGNTYDHFPQFQMVAGLEVIEQRWIYYLRDWQERLIPYLTKDGTHYNDWIVIMEDVLINKTDGNRQSRIQGYLSDSVLVSAAHGIGYLQIFTDGHQGKYFSVKPREATMIPDWKALGMQPLGTELRNAPEQSHELGPASDEH